MKSCNILKLYKSLVHHQTVISISLISCHEIGTTMYPLILCHGFCSCKANAMYLSYPLILCHGLCSSKPNSLLLLQLVSIHYPFTAIVAGMYSRGPPARAAARQACSATPHSARGRSVGVRSPAVKRPRPESCTSNSNTPQSRPADPNMPRQSGDPPTNKKRLDMSAEERSKGRDSVCSMCSDSGHTVRHHHFSSSAVRRQALSNKCETYMCPVCNFVESVAILPTQTRRIVIADSTLYGVWDHTIPLKMLHFDIDSIVGGRIRDMTRAWIQNYMHMPNRMEIVVVAGINNIGGGEKAEDILDEIREFKEMVKQHSIKWGHKKPSFISFCTIPYAPKYCSLQVPENPVTQGVAEWTPPPHFENRYEEVKKTNDMVIQMQRQDNIKMIRLDYHGVKFLAGGKLQHKFDTKPGGTSIWREKEVFKKLHFTVENKMKVLQYICKFYAALIKQSQP